MVGNVGYNSETNPVTVHSDEGKEVEYPTGAGWKPPHMEVVESWRRDTQAYPLVSSFRVDFSVPLHSVFCIEILEMNLPNVSSTKPAYREFLLLNGLFDGTKGFIPQREISKDRTYHTMKGTGYGSNPNVVGDFTYNEYAFGRFKYDENAGMQYWCRNGWHRKTFFPTPIPILASLDLSIADARGAPYDFGEEDNDEWSATFQIFAK